MRSSFFVLLSILVHALCVAAIAVAPRNIAEPQGNGEIEVALGEPADQPGIAESEIEAPSEAAQVEPIAPVQAEPVKAEPVKVEPVKPEPVKVVAKKAEPKQEVKKAVVTPAPAAPIAKAQASEEPATELPPKEELPEELSPEIDEAEMVAVPIQQQQQKEELVPVKETPPVGVEAATEEATQEETTEAASEDVNTAEETVAAAEAAAAAKLAGSGHKAVDDGQLAQGGATQAGAISYLDLKQAQGNRPPVYPLAARRQQRQGQLELLYRVTSEGKVTDIKVAKSSGHKDLDQAAVDAVTKFRFVPGQEGWARHPVAFALKGEATELPSKLRAAQTE